MDDDDGDDDENKATFAFTLSDMATTYLSNQNDKKPIVSAVKVSLSG